jgi:hypothetical protein
MASTDEDIQEAAEAAALVPAAQSKLPLSQLTFKVYCLFCACVDPRFHCPMRQHLHFMRNTPN